MIQIRKEDDQVVFEVSGMHKLWAFKNQLTIPADNIVRAHRDMERVKGWKGWRMPGTSVPGLITAGSYIKDGNWIFWDVCDQSKSIIVELRDEEYKQLVIEVEDPEEAIKLLSN